MAKSISFGSTVTRSLPPLPARITPLPTASSHSANRRAHIR